MRSAQFLCQTQFERLTINGATLCRLKSTPIWRKNWSRFPSPNGRKYHVIIRMWLVNGLEFQTGFTAHKTGCVQKQKIKQTDLEIVLKNDCQNKKSLFSIIRAQFVISCSNGVTFIFLNFYCGTEENPIHSFSQRNGIKPTRTLTSKSILVAMFKNRGFKFGKLQMGSGFYFYFFQTTKKFSMSSSI